MSNKLYVGNLSFQMQEDALKDAFASHGSVVSAKIITDRETGRSKGFGFVEMENEEQAQAAIDGLNGQEVDGRSLRVSVAREQQRGGGGRNRY
tara:strand:- start:106942 stop:107220 length:279 start_codon:yes stop_codon:yes gene_type:complete